jgi:hypothetical protein
VLAQELVDAPRELGHETAKRLDPFGGFVKSVAGGSVASRILLLLAERWPITLRQVAVALRLRADVVEREAKKLASQKLVVLEPLGDETYAALSGAGAVHVGMPAKEIERMRARRPAPAKPRDDADPAFS